MSLSLENQDGNSSKDAETTLDLSTVPLVERGIGKLFFFRVISMFFLEVQTVLIQMRRLWSISIFI